MTFPTTVIDTPFGKLRAWATSADHVGFSTKGDVNVAPEPGQEDNAICVNGVEYTYRINFKRTSSVRNLRNGAPDVWQSFGDWCLESYNSFTGHRLDRRDAYLSCSAHTKVRNILWPTLLAWIESEEGRDLINRATIERADQELENALAEVRQARANLAAAVAKVTELTKEKA